MTTPEDMREHHTQCVPYRVRLRMVAREEGAEPLPPGLVHEVGQATGAIVAGASAAGRVAVAADTGGGRGCKVARFLAARLARLAAAADDAVTAARDGNAVALRQHLQRFDSLTSALWTVQLAVGAQAASPP